MVITRKSRQLLSPDEVSVVLRALGFVNTGGHERKQEMRHGRLASPIYVNGLAGNQPTTLVIDPGYAVRRLELANLPGVISGGREWIHSHFMKAFPKRLNKGKESISYGLPFGVENAAGLNALVTALMRPNVNSDKDAFEDIANAEASLRSLSATERDAVVKARIGQGRFRTDVIQLWKTCSVTICDLVDLLVASHIKPWRNSTNFERLNCYNGLLLTPNLDRLFDKGFISFANSGELLMSNKWSAEVLSVLGIESGMRLRIVHPEQLPYLSFHRETVFQQLP